MANPEAVPAATPKKEDEPITRFQAQVHFGLFAKWDITVMIFLVLTWMIIGFYWWFRPEPSFQVVLTGLLVSILAALLWLVVLVYRVLVWLLDMRSEINLMPEAASRIVLGYYEGRKK